MVPNLKNPVIVGGTGLYLDALLNGVNDIPEVDNLTADMVNHFFQYLKTKRTFRGGVFTGGCSPFCRAAPSSLVSQTHIQQLSKVFLILESTSLEKHGRDIVY